MSTGAFKGANNAEQDAILAQLPLITEVLNNYRAGTADFHEWAETVCRLNMVDYEVVRVLRQIVRGDEDKARAAANRAKYGNVTPAQMEAFTVGAIVVDTWGWEQTNKDFYCIVARSGSTITLLPMESRIVEQTGFMSQSNLPAEIDWSGEVKRKRIKDDQKGFSLRPGMSGGWVTIWDGRREHSTHYA